MARSPTVSARDHDKWAALSQWADETQWHRVVYADGTPPSCHDGIAVRLLLDEGTPMVDGRVDLSRAQWAG